MHTNMSKTLLLHKYGFILAQPNIASELALSDWVIIVVSGQMCWNYAGKCRHREEIGFVSFRAPILASGLMVGSKSVWNDDLDYLS